MRTEFQDVLRIHTGRYPLMAPQDYGKLACQSEFGPAHMVPDREAALARLTEEWEALPEGGGPRAPEPIGNGLCRFHLTGAYDPREAAPLAAGLLLRTAREHAGAPAGLAEKLALLEGMGVPGMEAWLGDYRGRGCPPVRHSTAFREAYRPHYRVLRAEYAYDFPALLAAGRLARTGGPAVIAIDGRCGSGKTRLAALIRQMFPCNVFHMDDFYLPPSRRSPAWRETPGGNMDFARFRSEVLLPALAGEAVTCRPFDCRTGKLLEPVVRPARPLTVVEGSYAHHPALAVPYGLKIFLTCSGEEQARRLRAREGGYFQAFEELWIPMEERYFQRCAVEAGGALVIDTSGFTAGETGF